MDIKQEHGSGLVHELIIEFTNVDYAEKVEQALKKIRRTAQIAGFRPGNVPMGMVKKMYEKSLISEEVSKMLDETLNSFFGKQGEEKCILEPMLIEEKSIINAENSDKFVFTFEYVTRPNFELDFSKCDAVVDFKVIATDSLIDEWIIDMQRKYGTFSMPETADEADSVTVTYCDTNNQSVFSMKDLSEEGRKILAGKKEGDTIHVSLKTFFNTEESAAKFLDLKELKLDADNPYEYDLVIFSLSKITLAELNEAFFEKTSTGKAKTEEELRKYIAKNFEQAWESKSNQAFLDNAIETLVKQTNIEIPDDFIKRYYQKNDKKIAELIARDYNIMRGGFIWQLIENKIQQDYNISVEKSDIKNHIRQIFVENYFANFEPEEIEERLETLVAESLKDKENVQGVYRFLMETKLSEVLRANMKIVTKSGNLDAFLEELNKNKALNKADSENSSAAIEANETKEEVVAETVAETVAEKANNDESVAISERKTKTKKSKEVEPDAAMKSEEPKPKKKSTKNEK